MYCDSYKALLMQLLVYSSYCTGKILVLVLDIQQWEGTTSYVAYGCGAFLASMHHHTLVLQSTGHATQAFFHAVSHSDHDLQVHPVHLSRYCFHYHLCCWDYLHKLWNMVAHEVIDYYTKGRSDKSAGAMHKHCYRQQREQQGATAEDMDIYLQDALCVKSCINLFRLTQFPWSSSQTFCAGCANAQPVFVLPPADPPSCENLSRPAALP